MPFNVQQFKIVLISLIIQVKNKNWNCLQHVHFFQAKSHFSNARDKI